MAPRQMTEHTLNGVKGWPSPSAVDYSASFEASGSGGDSGLHDDFVAFSGSLVSLNSSGNYVYGVAAGAMPMWLFQNSDDPDVQNDGGVSMGGSGVAGAWHAVAPTGKMLALPAAGAYELATTEFSGVKGDYTPNIPLIPASNSDAGNNAARGQVDAGTTVIAAADTADVVGIVSRVGSTNSHGKDEVSFWPVYLPASAFAAGS
jgi:hypothetical protein